MQTQFEATDKTLQIVAWDFETISKKLGIEPLVTRVSDKIEGSSGVHEAGRGIDFRDEHPKKTFLYNHICRVAINSHMQKKFARKDGKPTAYWHSFEGGLHHWHIQTPAEPAKIYFNQGIIEVPKPKEKTMKPILKALGEALLLVLKEIDWKPIVYKGLKDSLLPLLKKKVADTESKWDDVAVSGLERIVELFLKPEESK